MDIRQHIRDIPDFPRHGILFRDITPLLKDAAAFREVVDRFCQYAIERGADVVAGIDARGFLFAAPVAYCLRKPLVPIRKHGKLPFEIVSVSYALEYGSDSVEIHRDAIPGGQRVLIVDDLLATGGTMSAAARLVEQTGGQVAGLAVVIELADLKGRELLKDYDVLSLVKY